MLLLVCGKGPNSQATSPLLAHGCALRSMPLLICGKGAKLTGNVTLLAWEDTGTERLGD